jgi:hypothetical protein
MTPIDQSKLVDRDGHGDCLRACLATLFDLPLEKVYDVNFPGLGYDEWRAIRNQFLLTQDRVFAGQADHLPADYLQRHPEAKEWPDIDPLKDTVGGYVIAFGASPRANGENSNLSHSVVMDWRTKEVVHDPHPSRAGLIWVAGVYIYRHVPGINALVRDAAWEAIQEVRR